MNAKSGMLAALLLAAPGFANANFSCAGNVTYLAVNSYASLYVAVNGLGNWTICNLAEPFTVGQRTVSKDACKAWYAGLLAAKQSDTIVTLYFDDSGGGADCTTIGSWVSAAPYHIDF